MVKQLFPDVALIAADTNLGFTRGNNAGISKARGQYVLLLNPDAELVGDALLTMVQRMREQPDVAVVGPHLRFPDGRTQSSRRRFPTLATALVESTVLQQWFPRLNLLGQYYVLDRGDDQEQDVDWVTGACMLVRQEAVRDTGLLDERFFMYSEELDWCRRFKGAGWRVLYLPQAEVIHHEAQSSGQVAASRDVYFHTSKVLYFDKHHGPWAGGVLRWFLLATFAYRLLLESAKWCLGHKRPMRRQRISAHLRVLRSGLRGDGMVPT
jgi:GT2 family glycosyltransferase